ncbi:hypothetical protein ACVBEH_17655, partial [Roseateles sp. GG27B]
QWACRPGGGEKFVHWDVLASGFTSILTGKCGESLKSWPAAGLRLPRQKGWALMTILLEK